MGDVMLDAEAANAKRQRQIQEQLADREPGGGAHDSPAVAEWRRLKAKDAAREQESRRAKSKIDIQSIPCITESLKRTLTEQGYWHGPAMQEYRRTMDPEAR